MVHILYSRRKSLLCALLSEPKHTIEGNEENDKNLKTIQPLDLSLVPQAGSQPCHVKNIMESMNMFTGIHTGRISHFPS
jgi:hypothetical protein